MKLIIIKPENADKIMEAFNTAQGRATVRMISRYEELTRIIENIEKRIGRISKKALSGTEVEYNFQQHFPNAYKHRPESTHFKLLFSGGSWRVDADSIKRYYCPNNTKSYEYDMKLSEAAKMEILKRYE